MKWNYHLIHANLYPLKNVIQINTSDFCIAFEIVMKNSVLKYLITVGNYCLVNDQIFKRFIELRDLEFKSEKKELDFKINEILLKEIQDLGELPF